MTAWGRRQQRLSAGASGTGPVLPESCCARLAYGETCRVDSEFAHEMGCLEALGKSARANAAALGAVACAIGLGQVALFAAACHLIQKVEKPKSMAPFY